MGHLTSAEQLQQIGTQNLIIQKYISLYISQYISACLLL